MSAVTTSPGWIYFYKALFPSTKHGSCLSRPIKIGMSFVSISAWVNFTCSLVFTSSVILTVKTSLEAPQPPASWRTLSPSSPGPATPNPAYPCLSYCWWAALTPRYWALILVIKAHSPRLCFEQWTGFNKILSSSAGVQLVWRTARVCQGLRGSLGRGTFWVNTRKIRASQDKVATGDAMPEPHWLRSNLPSLLTK